MQPLQRVDHRLAQDREAALREALRRMIANAALRRAFADGSWAAGQTLPRWRDTAARVAEALRAVAA